MAATLIADVIEPSIFTAYFLQRMLDRWAFHQAGVVSTDPRIDGSIGNGGRTINMPYWGDLTGAGASEVLSDTTPLTPQKIAALQDVAALNFRGKAFAANELAQAVAGSDPMAAIASQVADYWIMDMGTTVNAILTGIFGVELATSHTHDISIEDGDNAVAANLFSPQAFLKAAFLLGEHEQSLTAFACHSVIYNEMLNQELIDYVQPAGQSGTVPMYLGRRVIVDDNINKVAGGTSGFKYSSYLFGAGALGYGETPPPTPVETDRDSLQGTDYLIHRRHFVVHPRGVAWQGTAASTTPDNTELATAASWSKVYDDKAIKIVRLLSNG